MNTSRILGAMAVVAIAAGTYIMTRTPDQATVAGKKSVSAGSAVADTRLVAVTLPDMLSDKAKMGERAFAATCAACHGENAAGKDGFGPPLIHKIYESSHHGDATFFLAAQQGVRAHHWRFGDMPAQPGITRAEIASIVAYIREVQRANGIN